jgi:hypothetical protein
MKNRCLSGLALFAILCAGVSAYAQSDRGTITGTVVDPSGAAVPKAKVTATNLDTGATQEAVTSDDGNYTLPELKAAPYNVTVEVQGFKATTQEGVQVAVQTTRRVDFTLEIGAVSETVTITDEAPVIQSESSVRQTNVTERQVRELPLQVNAESGGRSPLAFIFLDSNVTAASATTGRATDAANFRVAGGQGQGTEILIDGGTTRRAQNGTFFSEVAPGPNAFQEFTISTSNYSAEFGQSSGGIVNFTFKSGSNELHGEVYDLFRNEGLNANSYRNNFVNAQNGCIGDERVAPNGQPCLRRPIDHQNNFGANVGGPVVIPWLYNGRDRTFFFFNYEGYRFRNTENVVVTVPTDAMRMGDFSELFSDPSVLRQFGPNGVQIYDPTQPGDVRQAIPGNRLDLFQGGRLIDPVGRAILGFFPEPNLPGVFDNYIASSTVPNDMNNYVAKVDHIVTDNQHLSVSYSYRKLDSIKGGFPRFPFPFIANGVWDQSFKSHYLRAQYDWTIGPTLFNHFNFAYNRVDVANRNTTEGFDPSAELGLPADATQNAAFPRIGFPGYGDPANPLSDIRAYQEIGSTFFSDRILDTTWEFSDALTWIKGNHTFKFGADFRVQHENVHQLIDPGGTFNFRHDQTASDADPNGGWPIASLITGATEFSFVTIHSVDPGWRYFTPSFFVNDDWKVTPKLTVNLGIRYDIPFPRTEVEDRLRGFDPTVTNPVVGIPGAIVGAAGQGGLQAEDRALVPTDYSNLAPRVGAAYRLTDKTVLRGGYGLYFGPVLYAGNITDGTLGYSTSRLITPAGKLSNAFLATYPAAPAVDPNGQFIGSDIQWFDPDYKTSRMQQWSFDIQQELPGNFVASAGYIGHYADRLKSNFTRLNALPLEALRLGAPLLFKPLANVTQAERNYAAAVGVPLPSSPDAVFAGFNGSVAQSLRPFPQYNQINNLVESKGKSWYNALQLKLDRRFSQGFQFGLSYTWSKLITNASEDLTGNSPLGGVLQNPFDIDSLRTVSPTNSPHVFVANYLVELPFGKGKRWLDHGGAVDYIVGGWQVGGISRYQAGLPYVVQSSRDTFWLSQFGYNGNLRPNLTGQPIEAPDNQDHGATLRLLNPGAFAFPQNFVTPPTTDVTDPAYAAYYADPNAFFGNAPPVIDSVRGPAFLLENLSLMKKTAVTETVTVEVRAEFFNVFNRHAYFGPANDINAGNFGFADVINDYSIYSPRVIQLGLRIIF